jgi:hypothetical protein
MAVDDRSRRALQRRLEEVLGAEAAATLIAHLPLVGSADIATHDDLGRAEERLLLELARIDAQLYAVDGRSASLERQIGARFDIHADLLWEALLGVEVTVGQSLRAQTTTLVLALVGTVLTTAALAFAIVRFSP